MRLTASFLIILLGFSSCFHKPENPKKQSLNGKWTLSGPGIEKKIDVDLPSGIHSALKSNGWIEDPYWDQNMDSLDWVWENDWVFSSEFAIDPDILKHEQIELVLENIDTHADVFINDSLVGTCLNYFTRKQIPIKQLLRNGKNKIRLEFKDPEKQVENDLALDRYTTAEKSLTNLENNLRSFIRKPAYHFGWDFSPKLITAGIYSVPEIVAWSNARIESIDLVRREDGIYCRISTETENPGNYSLQIEINGEVQASETISLEEGQEYQLIKLEGSKMKPWSPRGMGDQNLNSLKVQLLKDLRKLDQQEKTIGYSKSKLIQEEDSLGKSFYFQVNDKPVFARGGNLVPLDIQLDQIDPNDYEILIEKLARANFNMIRVWGGGHYPGDEFYDLCDKHGIMVWQDLMFANTPYSWDSLFVKSVEEEIRQQVIRLKDHPCIVLWCGNNEIELAWRNWGWQEALGLSPSDSALIWEKQKFLFDSLIPGVLNELDPGRSYLSSSPISNFSSTDDFGSGNMHDWAVWHGDQPIGIWTERSPRFNSEFGMQSISSLSLLENFTDDTLKIGDQFMSFRQRANQGWERLNRYISDHYRRPRTIEQQVYLSQIHQAFAIGEAAEFMRNQQPRTMGALVWQINDTWPGISWSVLDHEMNEKPAYYRLKKAFSPLVVYSDQKRRRLKIALLNESGKDFRGHAIVSRKNFFGRDLSRDSIPVRLMDGKSSLVFERYIGSILDTGQGRWTFYKTEIFDGRDLVQEDVHFMEKPRSLWLRGTPVNYKSSKTDGGILIELSSDFLAKDVWLEAENMKGYFEENLLDLVPGETKLVKFIPSEELSGVELRLKVTCLNDFR